jgi:hypothetical protein
LGYTLFYFSDGTAVSREVMVESHKDHISVPITHSTERLNEEKGDSSRSGFCYNCLHFTTRSLEVNIVLLTINTIPI